MIAEFVAAWEKNKDHARDVFTKQPPQEYLDIVRTVVECLVEDDEYGAPDPDRIHQIDDGDYQGTLVFVIAANGYQPRDYWYVRVSYGSCSGCDTLKSIMCYSDETPTAEQLGDYMTLALHIVQGLRKMGGEDV